MTSSAARRPRRAYRGSGHPGAPIERRPGAADRLPPDPRPETARHRRTALVWDIGWETARRLPEPIAFALADLLGRLAHRLARRTRQQVRRTLSRVVPPAELDATVSAAFRSYARYWVEAFRAADLDPDDLDARTTTGGFAHLDAALQRGRGVVVLLAHHGSWDVAAQWAETHGYHLAVVAEVLRPRALFAKFVRLREAVGLDVVPLRRGDALLERLSAVTEGNHLVGLLSDRDLSRSAPQVQLFGDSCRIPRGPAVLATRTDAAIIPITMLQLPGRRWHLQCLPEVPVDGLDVDEATRRVARALEDLIRLAPEQWHMFQPLYLDDLHARRGERRARARRRAR